MDYPRCFGGREIIGSVKLDQKIYLFCDNMSVIVHSQIGRSDRIDRADG